YYLSLATVESDTEGKPTEDTTNVLNVDRNLNFPVAFVPTLKKLVEEKREQQKRASKESQMLIKILSKKRAEEKRGLQERVRKKHRKLIDKIIGKASAGELSEKLAEEKRVQQKPTPKEAKRIYKKFHKLIDKIVRRVSERKPISQSDAKRLKRLINSISKLREHNYSGIDFY
ncbi:unnamed protein product, partial [Callosobruchus maculatus]